VNSARFASFALVLVLTPILSAQDLDRAAIERDMDAMVRLRNFMGAVLIARDGVPVFRESYGMADLEHSVANTSATKFRIGSVTKQFTAAAIMLLQEKDLLNVEDKVSEHVIDAPEAWGDITIHHLLTHTSGIANITALPEFASFKTLPTRPKETMARFSHLPLEFVPGEEFNYSNSGYVTLAVVIEEASGELFEDFVQENIFDPLDLEGTGHDDQDEIIEHRARGYTRGRSGFANAGYLDMELPIGGGDLYSTVDDLLAWDQALYTDRLLSDESRKAMFTPFRDNYGYGWRIAPVDGHPCIQHSGGIEGFTSCIMRFPDDKLTVIVLCNVQNINSSQIARRLATVALGG
jgi:CubicO group peptidase (beta-lactamase class C family)